MAVTPGFNPNRFRSGPKVQGDLPENGGLLGGFRNIEDLVDFNAAALDLAGDPGDERTRGLLGGQQGPPAMINPGSLPNGPGTTYPGIPPGVGIAGGADILGQFGDLARLVPPGPSPARMSLYSPVGNENEVINRLRAFNSRMSLL